MTLNAIHTDHFAGNECDWFILPSLRNAARGFTPQCLSKLSDLRDRKSIDAINITLSTFFFPRTFESSKIIGLLKHGQRIQHKMRSLSLRNLHLGIISSVLVLFSTILFLPVLHVLAAASRRPYRCHCQLFGPSVKL